jgi:hypothetical protein
MESPLADMHAAHASLIHLAGYNYTVPSSHYIARRDGQLGYSPLTGQWHTSTYAVSSLLLAPRRYRYQPQLNCIPSLDWCEANYDISIILARSWGLSIWLAEWWNCWSNVPFVLLALWGAYSTRQLPNRCVSGGQVGNRISTLAFM